MGGKKQTKIKNQIAQLEIRKRSGLIRALAAFVGLAVLISIKLNLVANGVEWADSMVANAAIFILAIVAAGIAGIGTRDWQRARKGIQELEHKLHK